MVTQEIGNGNINHLSDDKLALDFRSQNLWDRFTRQFKPATPKVDNAKIERLMNGGFLFGFTASDLFIFLASFLTLIFLEIQPYLIPYLEGESFNIIYQQINQYQSGNEIKSGKQYPNQEERNSAALGESKLNINEHELENMNNSSSESSPLD